MRLAVSLSCHNTSILSYRRNIIAPVSIQTRMMTGCISSITTGENIAGSLLNRLDEIIIFDILSRKTIRDIVEMQVEIVRERLSQKEIDLTVSREVLEYLARDGYNPKFGARPLKRRGGVPCRSSFPKQLIQGPAPLSWIEQARC